MYIYYSFNILFKNGEKNINLNNVIINKNADFSWVKCNLNRLRVLMSKERKLKTEGT